MLAFETVCAAPVPLKLVCELPRPGAAVIVVDPPLGATQVPSPRTKFVVLALHSVETAAPRFVAEPGSWLAERIPPMPSLAGSTP